MTSENSTVEIRTESVQTESKLVQKHVGCKACKHHYFDCGDAVKFWICKEREIMVRGPERMCGLGVDCSLFETVDDIDEWTREAMECGTV